MKKKISIILALTMLFSGCADNSAITVETSENITTELAETAEQTTAANAITTTLASTTAYASTTTLPDEDIELQENKPLESNEELHPFALYLENYTEENGHAPYGVLIEDINSDGQDEMVMHTNPFGNLDILYMKDEELKVIECDVMSQWGGTWYDRSANRIVNQYFRGHTEGTLGAYEYYVYDWNSEDYVLTMHLEMQSGYYEREADGVTQTDNFIYGDAFLNSEEITAEHFEELHAELSVLMTADNRFDAVFSGCFETDEILKKEYEEHYSVYINEKLYATDEQSSHYSPEILHTSDWNIGKKYYDILYLPIIEKWQNRLTELHFDDHKELFCCNIGDYVLLYTGYWFVEEPAAVVMSDDSFVLLKDEFYYGVPYFFVFEGNLFVYDRYLKNGISHNTFDEYSLHNGEKVSSYYEFYEIGIEITEPDGNGFNYDFTSFVDVADAMDNMTNTLFRAELIENPFYSA